MGIFNLVTAEDGLAGFFHSYHRLKTELHTFPLPPLSITGILPVSFRNKTSVWHTQIMMQNMICVCV